MIQNIAKCFRTGHYMAKISTVWHCFLSDANWEKGRVLAF